MSIEGQQYHQQFKYREVNSNMNFDVFQISVGPKDENQLVPVRSADEDTVITAASHYQASQVAIQNLRVIVKSCQRNAVFAGQTKWPIIKSIVVL